MKRPIEKTAGWRSYEADTPYGKVSIPFLQGMEKQPDFEEKMKAAVAEWVQEHATAQEVDGIIKDLNNPK